MIKELVIAAYQRDYGWIKYINHDVKIIVYRKGDKVEGANEIFIEKNVGQDVHTFFYHIVKNYDNLADCTIFSQDFPFDHISNYIEIINANPEYWRVCSNMTKDGYWVFSTASALNWEHPWPKEAYTGRTLLCKTDGYPHHRPPELDLDGLWSILFRSTAPMWYEFVPAGHFIVSKETILIRPKKFYEQVLEQLENRPFCPWEMERLEAYIFDKNIQ